MEGDALNVVGDKAVHPALLSENVAYPKLGGMKIVAVDSLQVGVVTSITL